MNFGNFKEYATVQVLCKKIVDKPEDLEAMRELRSIVQRSEKSFIRAVEQPLLVCFFPYIKASAANKQCVKQKEKFLIIETLGEVLKKLAINNVKCFFNFYTYLLCEVYTYADHKFLEVTEEYKLAVLNCMIFLVQSVDLDLFETLYVKENVSRLSQIVFVCGELIKNEKSRDIRCAAIKCLCAFGKVTDSDDFTDDVLRDKVAEVFAFFLPGICNAFTSVATENIHAGHRVLTDVLTAYGRLICVVMQNYKAVDEELSLQELMNIGKEEGYSMPGKFKDYRDMDQYINKVRRNRQWYKKTDAKLNISLKQFAHLTHYHVVKVRRALVDMGTDIAARCFSTMPDSLSTLIEFLIILTQDSDPNIATKSSEAIAAISEKLSSDSQRGVFESLEESFYNTINSLPRRFNSVDDADKVSAMNLVNGYLKLFGKHKLERVFLMSGPLQKIVETLLYISELKKIDVPLLQEYGVKDLTGEPDFRTPWIDFCHFKDPQVKEGIEQVCIELARSDAAQTIIDAVQDVFLYNYDRKKEAVFILNALVVGLKNPTPLQQHLLKNILSLYTDTGTYNLQDSLDPNQHNPEDIKDNVIMLCLLTEGIGKISLVWQKEFQKYLLTTLYNILEKAGNSHYLISAAGLLALNNVRYACGYSNITNLINNNFNFFSFQLRRRLVHSQNKTQVLSVLSVVLTYCDKDVLLPMSDIVEEVLLQTCDRYKEHYAPDYMRVFKMFITSLRRWFDISVPNEPLKSRKQKEQELEDFKVTDIDYEQGFSDDIMNTKSAEEMCNEDAEDGEYKKPESPIHIKLTASILRRALHFLPSKNQEIKLLVLEILGGGMEILREWDDEMLPIVHQVWSPLVERFKDDTDPLIMRLSVALLSTLARLSRDFIRLRTIKEVLPRLQETLRKLSLESSLKDRGAAYRYTQKYKLQQDILNNLGLILIHLDVDNKIMSEATDVVYLYFSNKQPQDLQADAVQFVQTVLNYDPDALGDDRLTSWKRLDSEEHRANVSRIESMT